MRNSVKTLGPLAATAGAKRYLNAYWGPTRCAVLPTTLSLNPRPGSSDFLYALDAPYLAAKKELREWFDSTYKVDTLPNGYAGPTAVAMTASALTATPGYPMNPNPIPLVNNSVFLQSLGISEELPARSIPIFRELFRLFFSGVRPEDLRIKRDGTTAFPYFLKNIGYKKDAVIKIMANVDHFLDLVTSDEPADLKRALDEYGFCYLYAIYRRMQPDSLKEDGSPKERTAPTEEEARSGSYAGKTFADKTVYNDAGQAVPGAFGMRVRDVFAFNGPGNYFMSAVFGGWRSVYMDRFSFTYKTRGREDKLEKASGYKYSTGADVKTMDKTIPKAFFDLLEEELAKYVDPRFAKFVRRALRAPYVSSNPWADTPESYEPLFGGDPTDPRTWEGNCVGLPSGIACNPDCGKLWMSGVYLTRLFDIQALTEVSEIEPFLEGKNVDHAMMDSADDVGFLSNHSWAIERWEAHESEMAVIGPERPFLYLGDVFAQNRRGQLMVVANITTYLINSLCKEQSIDKKPIRNIAAGHIARAHVYSSAPLFPEVSQKMNEVIRKHCGVNIDTLYRSIAGSMEVNDVDALFRLNPDVIHYRVDPGDVTPALLDEEIATIPKTEFWSKISHLYRSPHGTAILH